AIWATLKANAVFMVVNPQTKEDKIAYILADSGARALVVDSRLYRGLLGAVARSPDLRAIIAWSKDPGEPPGLMAEPWARALGTLPARPPKRTVIDQELAAITYTPWSTGEPKGVMLTHANMLAAAASITSTLPAREDDVVLCGL